MRVVLKNIPDENYICFAKPQGQYLQKIQDLLNKCQDKTSGYVSITIERPYKARTTGNNSQNNLIWKLITIIANEVGDDSEGMRDTENGIKLKAISKGYPYRLNPISKTPEPYSMTKINTLECSYLIDTAYQVIADLGIILPSELQK